MIVPFILIRAGIIIQNIRIINCRAELITHHKILIAQLFLIFLFPEKHPD